MMTNVMCSIIPAQGKQAYASCAQASSERLHEVQDICASIEVLISTAQKLKFLQLMSDTQDLKLSYCSFFYRNRTNILDSAPVYEAETIALPRQRWSTNRLPDLLEGMASHSLPAPTVKEEWGRRSSRGAHLKHGPLKFFFLMYMPGF